MGSSWSGAPSKGGTSSVLIPQRTALMVTSRTGSGKWSSLLRSHPMVTGSEGAVILHAATVSGLIHASWAPALSSASLLKSRLRSVSPFALQAKMQLDAPQPEAKAI